jgi:hypothetical protein
MLQLDENAVGLLALLSAEDGMSIHKACKKLALSMSEMMRLLTALGSDEKLGGLALVARHEVDGRMCLFLTPAGRKLCDEAADDASLPTNRTAT